MSFILRSWCVSCCNLCALYLFVKGLLCWYKHVNIMLIILHEYVIIFLVMRKNIVVLEKRERMNFMMEEAKRYAEQLIGTESCIHVSDFDRFSGLTPQDIYEILTEFEHRGEVVSVLETKCPHCGHWTGKYYEGFWDCPTTEICQVCGKSFGDLTAENSYLVWKVV